MEPVNELDIAGYRWEIKDTQARQDIAYLKTGLNYSYEKGRDIILKEGFESDFAKVTNINRQGALITAFVRITNLRGEGMNLPNLIDFANIQLEFMHSSPIIVNDIVSGKSFLATYSYDGSLSFYSIKGIEQGFNDICFNITSFEKQ